MVEPMYRRANENPGEWFVEYCRKVRNNTIEIHKVLNSNDYLDWLVRFSNQFPSLSDESLSAIEEQVDRYNLSRLTYLFEAIRLYADKSYIAPDELEDKYIYYLSYQGDIWQIGEKHSDLISYSYAKVTDVPEGTVVIDFTDMQEDKKLLQNDSLKVSLAELAKHIELLLDNGVPEEEIIKTTEDTINLKFKKKDQ